MSKRCEICGILLQEEASNELIACSRCLNNSEGKAVKKVNPIRSVFYVFEGFTLIMRNRRLVKLSMMPVVITAFILSFFLALFFYLVISQFNTMLPSIIDEEQQWLSLIFTYGAGVLGSLLMVILFLFLFIPISSLVCIPFNDAISMETEKILLGSDDKTSENFSFWKELKMMSKEIIKLLLLKIVVAACALPLLLIPGAGSLLFIFIVAMVTAIDFLDIVMARKKYNFREKLAFIRYNFPAFMGFSVPIILFFWIPFFQLFLIPAAAVGGTKFFLETKKFKNPV